jgi:hypothetical protein
MESFKNYPEQPPIKIVKRDWDDESLPKLVETFSFVSEFKGYKKNNGNGDSVSYAEFSGIGFSISQEKLNSVGAKFGDRIRIEKLALDPCYRGDGVVKIVNETNNKSATIKDWEAKKSEEWEEIRSGNK